ncbi:GTPase of the mitochondrial inner membrane that associates with the large ribosomal subunit [Tilletia horrida]|uniref:GTPase of the mitochondrial inner membrane that associates with the large ribosomal subunit n=1 Tax=Tilletia horrida TaxID=155126 RepID=A0AAN6JT62_9BASI|nr:GTPase of the mitochondrial inner membrane that associates with the large ribosomal subunit [Tilletia horrida]
MCSRFAHSSASFVDSAIVRITAGRGGDGCVAFAREKYIPYGPPSGGNGGDGGHIYVRASPGLRSLARVPSRVRASDGLHGKGQWQNGRKASDRTVEVPVGTVVSLLRRRMGQLALDADSGDHYVSAASFEPYQVRERAQALREEYEAVLRKRAHRFGEELPPELARRFEGVGDISNRPQKKAKRVTRRHQSKDGRIRDEDDDSRQNTEDPAEEPDLDEEQSRARMEAAAELAEEEALLRERRDTVWKQYPRGAVDARGEQDESEDDAAYRLFQLAHAEQRLGIALLQRPATGTSSVFRIPEGAVPASEAELQGDHSSSEPIVWTADLSVPTPVDSPGLLVALGGQGGLGNPFFLTTVNRSPKYATRGSPGDDLFLHMELKTSADVGFVGFPNAGKSSLLQALTGAHGMGAEVGSWQFTTTSPNVGVMRVTGGGDLIGTGSGVIADTKNSATSDHAGSSSASEPVSEGETFRLVLADIPGLLPGAGTHNVGLGHDFLRHIERCSSLIYVLDISPSRERPWEDLRNLREELEAYQQGLSKRGALIVANKADLLGKPPQSISPEHTGLERSDEQMDSASRAQGLDTDASEQEPRTTEEEAHAKLDRLRKEARKIYEEDLLAFEEQISDQEPSLQSKLSPPMLMPVIPVSAKWRLNVDQVARRLRNGLVPSTVVNPSGARSFSTSAARRERSAHEDRDTPTVAVDSDGIPTMPTWSVQEMLDEGAVEVEAGMLSDETLIKLHRLAALRPPKTEAERAGLRAELRPMVELATSVRASEIDPAYFSEWTGEKEGVFVDARVGPSHEGEVDHDIVVDETPELREGEYDGTEEMPKDVLLGMAARRAGDFFVADRDPVKS